MKEIEILRDKTNPDDPSSVDLEARYLAHSKETFEILFAAAEESAMTKNSSSNSQRRGPQEFGTSLASDEMKSRSEAIWTTLKSKTEPPKPLEPLKDPHIAKGQQFLDKVLNDCKEKGETPTTDQLRCLQIVSDHIDHLCTEKANNGSDRRQLLLFIHGGPGVGKTWVVNTIREMLEKAEIGSVSTAFTGAAASMIPTAETIHSLFTLPIHDGGDKLTPLNNTQLALAAQRFENKGCIIFDEVSMISTSTLARCSQRLAQITGKEEKAFGGKDVILVGDFHQLRPVAGSALYTDTLRLLTGHSSDDTPRTLKMGGVMAFSRFRLVELSQQVRAAGDPAHSARLAKMRDLSVKQPVGDEVISYLRGSVLTAADLAEVDNPWLDAPVCVTSNAERHNLTPILAQRYALLHGVPIITWNLPATGLILTRMREGAGNEDAAFTLESGLVAIFVAGAPAYITENIHPSLGLANGTLVRLHSLSLSQTGFELGEIETLLANTSAGQRVHLPSPPAFVNVSLPEGRHQAAWPAEWSLIEGEAVLPIGLCSSKSEEIVKAKLESKMFAGKVHVTQHRVELGFVITFHKIQGKTVKNIILELNPRPFPPRITFNMLLVAISRVLHGDGLRILRLKAGETLDDLRKLKPDPNLAVWMANFDSAGWWTPQQTSASTASTKKKRGRSDTTAGPAKKRPKISNTAKAASQAAGQAPPKPKISPKKNDVPVQEPERKRSKGQPEEPRRTVLHAIPATLHCPVRWLNNSCHFDAFLESVYALLVTSPGTFMGSVELDTGSVDRVFRELNDPVLCLLALIKHRHTKDGDKWLKQEAWRVFDTIWNRGLCQPGQHGTPEFWARLMANDSEFPIFAHTLTSTTICPQHGARVAHQKLWIVSFRNREQTMTEGFARWLEREKEDRVQSCFSDGCHLLCNHTISDFRVPQFLVVERATSFDLGDAVHDGATYSLRAAIRMKGRDHFVTYVKHQGLWYYHDGMSTPMITAVQTPSSSAGFSHYARFYLYSRA